MAASAVEQIQAAQKANPLVRFTDYQPAGVAGLSPYQQFALQQMIPATLESPEGVSGLLGSADRVQQATRPANATRTALESLQGRLGGSMQLNRSPLPPGSFQPPATSPGRSLAFPGMQPRGTERFTSGLTDLGANPGTPNLMPPQAPLAMPSAPPPDLNPLTSGSKLTPEQQAIFQELVRGGMTPAEAMQLARTPQTPPPPPQDGSASD